LIGGFFQAFFVKGILYRNHNSGAGGFNRSSSGEPERNGSIEMLGGIEDGEPVFLDM
jgi:hypothetical protein